MSELPFTTDGVVEVDEGNARGLLALARCHQHRVDAKVATFRATGDEKYIIQAQASAADMMLRAQQALDLGELGRKHTHELKAMIQKASDIAGT